MTSTGKFLGRVLLLAAALLALVVALPARAAPAGQAADPPPSLPPNAVEEYILIKLNSNRLPSVLAGRLEPVVGHWYRLYNLPGQTAGQTWLLAAALNAVQRLSYDEERQFVEPPALPAATVLTPAVDFPPNDPHFGRQWHMPQIGLEAAWGINTGANADTGEPVVVAVIDTGVAVGGADGFCNPLHSEFNAITNSTLTGAANDGHSHGTHVAGTVAGCANNGIGVVGVAPGAQIMAVKVLADSGNGSLSDVAEGIRWAADHGAQVINMSLGSACAATWPTCSTPIVNDGIAYAAAADVVVVISAGNDNRTFVGQPGNHPEAVAVAATDYARNRAPYSNRGVALSLAAPGGNSGADLNDDGFADGVLQETRQNNVWGYYYKSGTSMAAPHVAGAAALLRACVPEADRAAVRDMLEGYALDLGAAGKDTTYGHGFLQVDAALAGLAYAYGRDPEAYCAVTGAPPPCFTLATSAIGPGTISVEPPADCDPDGGEPAELTAYSSGTRLTLTAAPDSGYLFGGWGDDAGGANNPLSLRITRPLTITASFVLPPPELSLLFSLKTDGTAAGLPYADEDVLNDDPVAGLSLLFDGSAQAVAAEDVDGLARLADGSLLLSFESPAKNLPGIGAVTVDDSDVVHYNPATGQYSWYFDGSDVGLTTSAEDVDALALLPDGRLLLSTYGALKVTGLTAADEDVVAFNGVLGSDTTSGSWALYFDTSDVSTSLGDVDGVAYSPGFGGGPELVLLSAEAGVTLGGVNMAPGDVIACAPISLGNTTRCDISRYWQGTANGLATTANVDAIEIHLP